MEVLFVVYIPTKQLETLYHPWLKFGSFGVCGKGEICEHCRDQQQTRPKHLLMFFIFRRGVVYSSNNELSKVDWDCVKAPILFKRCIFVLIDSISIMTKTTTTTWLLDGKHSFSSWLRRVCSKSASWRGSPTGKVQGTGIFALRWENGIWPLGMRWPISEIFFIF